jgi:polysaccharide biosynthesis transport protein
MMADGARTESSFELRDYLQVLSRRKFLVILAAAVAVAVSLVSSFLQTPVYQAESRLLLQPSSSTRLFEQQSGSSLDPQRDADTAIQVLKSASVKDAVKKQLGSAPSISASVVGETNVVAVKARSTSPGSATRIANAYVTSYVEFKRSQAIEENLAASTQVKAKIDDLQRDIKVLEARVSSADPEQRDAVERDVARQRDALFSQQATFKQTLDQLQVRTALDNGGAQVVSPAPTPSSPVAPTKARSAALALLLGLILGVAIAFAVEHLDDSIGNMEDLERATDAAPVIALVPAFSEAARGRLGSVVTLSRQTSRAGEAYRSLRTSVQFMSLDTPIRTIQITSPNPFEGKTTTVANLGVAIAGTGTRVAVVDLDLRRPRLHEVFDLDNEKGFTSVLLGRVALDDALQPISGPPVTGLATVLPAGPVPPNPSELLSSPRVQKLLDELNERVDMVLLDSPPVLPVTDALVVSRCADALLLVTKAGRTSRHGVRRAVELLQQVGAPIRGVVLNGVSERESYGYGYGGRYGYGYGHGYGDRAESGAAPRRAKRKRTSEA